MNNDTPSVLIDEMNLDRECIRLPHDYLVAANASASSKRDVAELDAALDVVKSDLAKEVRTNPSEFGIEKLTESALAAVVTTLPSYQKALRRLQEARYRNDLDQALVWAMEHKKRSLSLLVDLHGMGYFSAVKLSPAGREAVTAMTQKTVRRSRED